MVLTHSAAEATQPTGTNARSRHRRPPNLPVETAVDNLCPEWTTRPRRAQNPVDGHVDSGCRDDGNPAAARVKRRPPAVNIKILACGLPSVPANGGSRSRHCLPRWDFRSTATGPGTPLSQRAHTHTRTPTAALALARRDTGTGRENAEGTHTRTPTPGHPHRHRPWFARTRRPAPSPAVCGTNRPDHRALKKPLGA